MNGQFIVNGGRAKGAFTMQLSHENDKIIMYGTPACPSVPPMKGLLKQSNVPYDYINIFDDLSARERVREINHGNESVPTFVFPDGSTLTEPSTGEIKKKLEEMGYKVPFHAVIMGNLWLIFVVIAIIFAVARAFGLF